MHASLIPRTAILCAAALTISVAQATNAPVTSTPAGVSSSASSNTSSTPWYQTAWNHARDTWREGDVEVYVPFWSYHLPFA
jgi:hypothetical protein